MREKRTKLRGFYSNSVLTSSRPARLNEISIPCDFVMLSVSNTADDPSESFAPRDPESGYDETKQEVYWGFDAVCVHQLFPKDSTDLIPVSDVQDIFVRHSTKKGGPPQRIGFSCFRYEEVNNEKKS